MNCPTKKHKLFATYCCLFTTFIMHTTFSNIRAEINYSGSVYLSSLRFDRSHFFLNELLLVIFQCKDLFYKSWTFNYGQCEATSNLTDQFPLFTSRKVNITFFIRKIFFTLESNIKHIGRYENNSHGCKNKLTQMFSRNKLQ